jgi:uncharacterized protein (TIGR03435 family)
MRDSCRIPALLIVCSVPVFAQSFDVASVKPAAPPAAAPNKAMAFTQASQDPGRLTLGNQSLTDLIVRAYRLPRYQVTAPGWMDNARFDIIAKIPAGSTNQQVDMMLQKLLAERFHIAVHRETKEIAAYELVVGKKGSKLKVTDYREGASQPPPPPRPMRKDANGFPIPDSPNVLNSLRTGPHGAIAHMAVKAQPLSVLVNILSRQMHAPVIDRTGLTAKYDFTLEYAPQAAVLFSGSPASGSSAEASLPDESGTPIQTAIQQQLGLKLEAKKSPIEMLVVDKADKVPTEN